MEKVVRFSKKSVKYTIIILFYVQSKTSIIVGCIVSICYALIVNFNVIRFILIKSELKSRK